jgi:hypothetical protein
MVMKVRLSFAKNKSIIRKYAKERLDIRVSSVIPLDYIKRTSDDLAKFNACLGYNIDGDFDIWFDSEADLTFFILRWSE